ncbi:MAG: hypothetical protein RSD14_01300 [Clostridia bacterium]
MKIFDVRKIKINKINSEMPYLNAIYLFIPNPYGLPKSISLFSIFEKYFLNMGIFKKFEILVPLE